jgi:hypothetical protein
VTQTLGETPRRVGIEDPLDIAPAVQPVPGSVYRMLGLKTSVGRRFDRSKLSGHHPRP